MAEYIDRKAALSLNLCIGINCQDCPFKMDSAHSASGCRVEDFMKAIPAADVVARDCYDRLLAENDELRRILGMYGGKYGIMEAFEAKRKLNAGEIRPVVTCSKCKYNKRCMVQFFVEDERLLPFNADTWFCPDGVREEEEPIKAENVKTHREPYDILYEEGGANTT